MSRPNVGHFGSMGEHTVKANKKAALAPEPLYKRAEAALIERLVDGTWRVGERLPNEFELAAEFNISQGTMRKALAALEQRGLLHRAPGRGTTVSRTTNEESLYAFYRLRDSHGRLAVPETVEETISAREASDEEHAALRLVNAEVLELSRVRANGGEPLAVERMVFPAELCAGMADDLPLPNSLYPYLQDRFGIVVMTACETLTAEPADDRVAAGLGIEVGAPVLAVTRQARDLAERTVELRRSWYLTRHASYRVELTRAPGSYPATQAV